MTSTALRYRHHVSLSPCLPVFQLEDEAISASQAQDVKRNLVLDIFGSDDDDDALETAVEEAQEDDDLEAAIVSSQAVTNREEMELEEVLALSQRVF